MDKNKTGTVTKKDDSLYKKQGIGVITKTTSLKEVDHEKYSPSLKANSKQATKNSQTIDNLENFFLNMFPNDKKSPNMEKTVKYLNSLTHVIIKSGLSKVVKMMQQQNEFKPNKINIQAIRQQGYKQAEKRASRIISCMLLELSNIREGKFSPQKTKLKQYLEAYAIQEFRITDQIFKVLRNNAENTGNPQKLTSPQNKYAQKAGSAYSTNYKQIQANQTIFQLKNQNQKLTKENNQLSQQILYLEVKQKTMRNKIQNQLQQKFRIQQQSYKKTVQSLNFTIAELRNELRIKDIEAKQNQTSFQQYIRAQQQKRTKLQKQQLQRNKKIQSLKKQFDHQKDHVEALKEEKQNLLKKNRQLLEDNKNQRVKWQQKVDALKKMKQKEQKIKQSIQQQKEQLQQRYKQLNAIYQKERETIKDLTQSLNKKDTKLFKLQAQIKEQIKAKGQLRKKISEQQEYIQIKQEQLKVTSTKQIDIRMQNGNLYIENNQLREECEERKRIQFDLQKENNSLRELIGQKEKEKQEMRQKLDQQIIKIEQQKKSEIKVLMEDNGRLSSKIKQIEIENQRLITEINQVKKKQQQYQQNLNKQIELKERSREKQYLRAEVEGLNRKLEEMDENNKKISNEQIGELKSKLEESSREKQNKEIFNHRLIPFLQKLLHQYSLISQSAPLFSQTSNILQLLDILQQKLDSQSNKTNLVSQQVLSQQNTFEILHGEDFHANDQHDQKIQKQQNSQTNLQIEQSKLQSQSSKVINKQQQLSIAVSNLRSELTNKDTQIVALQSSIELLRAEIEEINAQKSNITSELQSLKEQNISLKAYIDAATAKVIQFHQKIQSQLDYHSKQKHESDRQKDELNKLLESREQTILKYQQEEKNKPQIQERAQFIQLTHKLSAAQQQITELKKTIQTHQASLKNANRAESTLVASVSKLTQQNKKLTEQNKKLQKKLQKKIEENKQINELFNQMSESNGQLRQMYNEQLQEKSRRKPFQESLNNELKEKERVIESLQQQIANIERQNNSQQLRQRQKNIASLNEQIIQLLRKSSAYQIDLEEYRSKERNTGQRTDKLEISNMQLLQKCQKLEKEKALLEEQLKKSKQQIQKEKKAMETTLLQTTKYIEKLQIENKRPKTILNVNSSDPDYRAYFLFQNRVLQDSPEFKVFIKNSIQKHLCKNISRTHLVYFLDPLNNLNIHKYIDKKENLLVVIKLLNGFYVAAFTEDYFQPKRVSTKSGLILALNQQQVFTLVQHNKRAITYDDFFVIFGNSEVRLRTGEKKLFSNFGINNSFYNSRGCKVPVLLGGGPQQREVLVDHYEFYQIEFE